MGTREEDDEGRGAGARAASAAGAAGAAGAALAGAQALLGMDVAEAAEDAEGAPSVVPLGEVTPTAADVDVDLDADVAAFLDEDATVMTAGGPVGALDPLADLGDVDDPSQDLLALDDAGPDDLDLEPDVVDEDLDV